MPLRSSGRGGCCGPALWGAGGGGDDTAGLPATLAHPNTCGDALGPNLSDRFRQRLSKLSVWQRLSNDQEDASANLSRKVATKPCMRPMRTASTPSSSVPYGGACKSARPDVHVKRLDLPPRKTILAAPAESASEVARRVDKLDSRQSVQRRGVPAQPLTQQQETDGMKAAGNLPGKAPKHRELGTYAPRHEDGQVPVVHKLQAGEPGVMIACDANHVRRSTRALVEAIPTR